MNRAMNSQQENFHRVQDFRVANNIYIRVGPSETQKDWKSLCIAWARALLNKNDKCVYLYMCVCMS